MQCPNCQSKDGLKWQQHKMCIACGYEGDLADFGFVTCGCAVEKKEEEVVSVPDPNQCGKFIRLGVKCPQCHGQSVLDMNCSVCHGSGILFDHPKEMSVEQAVENVERGLGGVEEAKVLKEELDRRMAEIVHLGEIKRLNALEIDDLAAKLQWEQECGRMLEAEGEEVRYYARLVYRAIPEGIRREVKSLGEELDRSLSDWVGLVDINPKRGGTLITNPIPPMAVWKG